VSSLDIIFFFFSAMPSTFGVVRKDSDVGVLQGRVEMEHPNKVIDSFSGVLELRAPVQRRDPILATSVLLRGCVLRNTEYAYGLVLNTGHDTKIMMSAAKTHAKTSNLESRASGQVLAIIGLLMAVCFTGSMLELDWNTRNDVSSI
jgi:magnesium-transporting ATPase (P-type)